MPTQIRDKYKDTHENGIHVDGFFSIVLLKGHFKERNVSEVNTDRRTLYRCKPINTIAPTD